MTSLLSWKPEYSVNESELDTHHQKLFSLLNTAYSNVMKTEDVDCVLPIIDELSEYTKYHFSAEVKHMREIEFEDINAHIATHSEFTKKIEALRSRYDGNNLEATKELIIFLGNWLLNHVLKEDRKYSEMSTGS